MINKMETGGSLGYDSVCSTCDGSFPRGRTPCKIPGCCQNAEGEFVFFLNVLKKLF